MFEYARSVNSTVESVNAIEEAWHIDQKYAKRLGVLRMNKRAGTTDWSKLANASPKPKRLHLEANDCDGLFHCPVQGCRHDGFGTQRGCRKHVKKKHSWFTYFDEQPTDSHKLAADEMASPAGRDSKDKKHVHAANSVPSFNRSGPIAEQYSSWLVGSGDG